MNLVGTGRTADVWALDDARVLRRYRDGRSAEPEAELLRHLHAHGFPVPPMHLVDGPEMTLGRVGGPTMLHALSTGGLDLHTAARIVLDLHALLHAVPPRGPGEAILHMDLHPDNVLLGPDGPVLIDWCNAIEGPPGLDLAMTAVILGQVAVDGPFAEGAAAFARPFIAASPSLLPHLDNALAHRAADPHQSAAELAALPRAADFIRAAAG
ncbi:phosphotransferase [Catenuloplanes sp. NPDC051500]|uniref:phosphotransferase n=1 Tax=Catenuloplanes sp. NPDC051500 TaxID=3363959 RepID=UPI003798FFCC